MYCVRCGSTFPCPPSHFHVPPPPFPRTLSVLPPSPLHASRVCECRAANGVHKWRLHATSPHCRAFPTLCMPLPLVRHLPRPPPCIPSPSPLLCPLSQPSPSPLLYPLFQPPPMPLSHLSCAPPSATSL